MHVTQRLREFFVMLVLAAGAPLAGAAEPEAGAGPALPAWPAALDSGCESATCPDTLHTGHDVTFISRLSFPLNRALLTREAQNELQRLLVELESFAVIEHLTIVGHADPSGPERYNRWLSELRAKRVQDYFAQHGVDPRKVSTRGAGASEPLAGAIDPAEHRRIEIHVTLQPFL